MLAYIKKNWGNALLVLIIIILIIPQTAKPIKVLLNRYLAFSPSEIDAEKQETLEDYTWPLLDLSGDVANLSASEGKVAVVNLWATWCPPCVAEMPSFQTLYNNYKDRVDFYFVSSESPDVLERFLDKKGYDLPIYLHGRKVPELLKNETIPTTYVLSKTGKIVVDKTGAARWDSESMRDLLDTLLSE